MDFFQHLHCEGARQWQAGWGELVILRRERHDRVSRLLGRVQKWGEEGERREKKAKRNWIQGPRRGSVQEGIQVSLESGGEDLDVMARKPEVLWVGVEGVHKIEAAMD